MKESVLIVGFSALLVLVGTAPATAATTQEIAARAAAIPSSDLEDDEWPFERLPSALQVALRQAALERDTDGAVDRLASALDGDRDAATSVLGAAAEVVADPFPDCEEQDAASLNRMDAELVIAIVKHPTAEEALAAISLFYDSFGQCFESPGDRLLEGLTDTADGRNLAERLALRLDRWSPLRRRFLGFAAGDSPSLSTLEAMADSVGSDLRRATLLEAARAKARKTAPERLSEIERRSIDALLTAGLPAAAVQAYEAAAEATREAIRRGEPVPVEGQEDDWETSDLRLDLAAALALLRDDRGAKELLATIPADRRVVSASPSPQSSQKAEVRAEEARLWQALDRLVSAQPPPEDPFDLLEELAFSTNSQSVGGLSGRTTAQQALAQLALREGYEGFARYFFRRFAARAMWEETLLDPAQATEDASSASFASFAETFPRANRAARDLCAQLVQRREALAQLLSRDHLPDGASARIGELLSSPRPVPFRERALPEGVPVGDRGEPELSDGLTLPPDLGVVRAERRGDEAVAVGVSQDLDPVGEVSAGGYWVARSSDGGASWTKLYTGLQQLQPYEVVERSALPLMVDGGLQIEVRVRQLDESTLTFPPVGLQMKRSEDGLVLEISWENLERDSDGDGLTDLVEDRLLTDPERADSDGDGVYDAEDPLPFVAFSAADDPSSGALAALLTQISGEQARAILPRCPDGDGLCFGRAHLGERRTHFVVSERSRWAGLAPRQRTIVLTPDELEAAKKRFGIFFATRFPLVEVDRSGTRAIIIWDRDWQGGSATLHRGEDGWVVDLRSMWIT